ncbi:MAG: hypothetical protein JWN95_1247 [Frankiales bacterium]|nr:hypothetical protein [Frankiales bacterium]
MAEPSHHPSAALHPWGAFRSRFQSSGAESGEWRDHQAVARFELFLFSAVATVLVVRASLAVAGYPQVGGGGLHVAHVLWGGLLMGVAIVLVEIFPGSRVRVRAALLGGVGFGLFIDEIGKFLTKDVNYFFKPAVAIMYAVFVVLYLTVREVLQRWPLDDRRRLALASTALSDLALGQLDAAHRDYALRLLDGVDETSGLAKAADAVREGLLAERPSKRSPETVLTELRDRITQPVDRVLLGRSGDTLLLIAAVLMLIDTVLGVVLAYARPGRATGLPTLFDTVLPSAVGVALMVVGLVRLRTGHRESGVEWLQRAVLIELLVTEVVVFNRVQWLGLIGFVVDIIVLWLLSLVSAARRQDTIDTAKHSVDSVGGADPAERPDDQNKRGKQSARSAG